MKCVNPFVGGRAAHGCGQCMPCRFNRRRTWTHRIMLEAMSHEKNCFVTLTYSDANLPRELSPEDLRDFLKRLRRRVPVKIRYFAVGEYGDHSQRPHYHLAIFGLSCDGGPVRDGECRCSTCLGVRETWGLGFVHVGRLEPNSAQYLCGYVVKKMTHATDFRLDGRRPEFARMSLRPGIGANAMLRVVSAMSRYHLQETLPSQLRHGKRLMPLGRYLRKKLSEGLGQDELQREKLAEKSLSVAFEELCRVRSYAFDVEKSVREVFTELNEGYERTLAGRQALGKRRSL